MRGGIPGMLVIIILASWLVLRINSLTVHTPPWPSAYWDIPGDYCRGAYPAGACCTGRQDRCNTPILGSLCYCDTFCNRTVNSDCCPDYFTHCEGLPSNNYGQNLEAIEGKESIIGGPRRDCEYGVLNNSKPECMYKGEVYSERDTIPDNCNTCKCQVSISKPGCMEVLCSMDQCLIDPLVLSELEKGSESGMYNWQGANYTEFWGRTLEEGAKGRLGAIRPDHPITKQVAYMSAIEFSYSPSTLPVSFLAETVWPRLLSSIIDQGWCSSSWAISTVGVASDRISIGHGQRVTLGAQGLLNCDTRGQGGCKGGHVDQAWHFLRKTGVWEESCVPYSGGEESTTGACTNYNCQAYKMQPAYRVGRYNTYSQPRRREEDIMYEVMNQGPVQTLLQIHTDFFMYKRGIYSVSNLAREEVVGYHAVRIVGWGEERGIKYWTLANSWGTDWGEDGYFRIARGSNECKVEEFVLGVWPKRNKRTPRVRHNQRDTARFFSERQNGRRTRHGRRPLRGGHDGKQKYHQVG